MNGTLQYIVLYVCGLGVRFDNYYNYSMGVAKVSVERGLLVLRVYNWGWITVRYTEQRGVRYSGVSDVLKSMEKRSGLSELSVISWVSAIEGCPLSGAPLYFLSFMYNYVHKAF